MRFDPTGWLVQDSPTDPVIERIPTERTCGIDPGGPFGVCWHWTGGDYARDRGHLDSRALAEWIAKYDRTKDTPASWHMLVDKDGAIIQSAPVSVGTWHVGKRGKVLGVDRHVNRALVGVELENAGRLRMLAGNAYAWPYYLNPDAAPDQRQADPHYQVDKARAVAAKGGLYDAFTPEQEASAVALVRALHARFAWPREAFVFGHRDFDFPRKEDPGPLWADTMLPRVLEIALGGVR